MTSQTEQDKIAQLLKYGRCTGYHCGGRGLAEEPHTCPYSEEINNDYSTCNCCEACQQQCTYDI